MFDNKPCKYKFLLFWVLSCGTTESWVPPQYLANLVEILYTCSTCDTGIWATEVRCTTFGIAIRVNKNCSKITVITWHALSYSSKSMKALEVFFSHVRFLKGSIKSVQGRTDGRAGEFGKIKRSLIDKFFFWKRLSLNICFLESISVISKEFKNNILNYYE